MYTTLYFLNPKNIFQELKNTSSTVKIVHNYMYDHDAYGTEKIENIYYTVIF